MTEVSINFSVKHNVPFGKALYIVGSVPELGSWQCQQAHRLRHSQGNNWNASIKMIKYEQIEFKYFVSNFDWINKNQIDWENLDGNRKMNVEQIYQQCESSISMCSFNIRIFSDKDEGTRHWDARKDRIFNYFEKNLYDIIGIQEANYLQRLYLQTLMSKYSYFGSKRQRQDEEECGIFVKKNKFVLIEDHYDWISQTNEEGLIGYDANKSRYFTTLLIAPQVCSSSHQSMPCILISNLHLDDLGSYSRKKGIQQVVAKCTEIKNRLEGSELYDLVACVIMGDFNEIENSSYFEALKNENMPFQSFRKIKGADQSLTYNGFQNKYVLKIQSLIMSNFFTIDHMFYWVRNGVNIKPVRFDVEKKQSLEYISDHYPIVGQFKTELLHKEEETAKNQ